MTFSFKNILVLPKDTEVAPSSYAATEYWKEHVSHYKKFVCDRLYVFPEYLKSHVIGTIHEMSNEKFYQVYEHLSAQGSYEVQYGSYISGVQKTLFCLREDEDHTHQKDKCIIIMLLLFLCLLVILMMCTLLY